MGSVSTDLLALVAEALDEAIGEVHITALTGGNSGVSVKRVTGATDCGRTFSVVVKERHSHLPHAALWYAQDHAGLDREYRVYQMLEQLDLPHAKVLARRYESPGSWILVLEDLAEHYVLPGADRSFTESDKFSIIDTYALIHSRTVGTDMGPAGLQPEEGSEVTAASAADVLNTLSGFEIDSVCLRPNEFDYALAILLKCRTQWADEPRCLVFSDFHQTNVALPADSAGQAILFDWELARIGLPQFDALNAGFADDAGLIRYAERVSQYGGHVDLTRFRAGLRYAELSGVFYTLWLLHLKLNSDPGRRLPKWMGHLAMDLFSGGLVARARAAGSCCFSH